MRMSTECSKQRGASALEASVAVIPVLLVCLLGVELVHAHQVKQLVSLALQEAGRVASVTAADHDQVNQAFARALAPRFASASHAVHTSERRDATIERYRRHYALPLWQLRLKHPEVWGAKPHDHRTVRLDLIYLHEPLQSWLRQVLKQSARWPSANPSGLSAKARRQGLVAMQLSRRAVIHSSTVQQRPKSSHEETVQQPGQKLNAWQTLTRDLSPEQPTALTATSSKKPSPLILLRQKPEDEDLCGVLLCCAP